ncbi:MAG: hypothetical protein HFJ33_05775 [Clostridia bacterium]|nr:hypothetical protein [Clostridia bacterium]
MLVKLVFECIYVTKINNKKERSGKNECMFIQGYNKIADWCYQKLVKNDVVAIEGCIVDKMEVMINEIEYF